MAMDRTTSVQRLEQMLQQAGVSLVLREAFFGVRRFGEFQQNLGISRSVLARAMKSLVDQEVMRRVQYQERPDRFEYRLTESGMELYPVFLAMKAWGDRWLGGDGPGIVLHHKTCGHDSEPRVTCDHCGEQVRAREMSYSAGEQRFRRGG